MTIPAGTYGGATLTAAQTAVAGQVFAVAYTLPLPPAQQDRAALAALMTAWVESRFSNPPLGAGDKDSVGVMQQRLDYWAGVPDVRGDVTGATRQFLTGVQTTRHTARTQGLTGLTGWTAGDLGGWCQTVQHSGFPLRYGQEKAVSDAVYAALKGLTMASEPPITLQAAHTSGTQSVINRLVIHATCSDVAPYPHEALPGTAHSTARYFSSSSSGGSAHYVCGVEAEEHCVKDDTVAWHAPPNHDSIGIEITADGGDPSVFHHSHNYTRDQWLSPQVWPAVQRAARRTRDLCARHNVPVVQLSTADLKAGHRGITGHVNVSQAFGQTNHTDVGANFPWLEFMAEVKGAPAPKPTPTPAPKPAPTPTPAPTPKGPGLTVNGHLDSATIKALQHTLGTGVDGVISSPSAMVSELQRFLIHHGAHLTVDGYGLAQDGKAYQTVKALQHYLGTGEDGIFSVPVSGGVKALQHRLNSGRL